MITYDPPQPNAALVVGPDDHLVITLVQRTTPEELKRFVDSLHERYPELKGRTVVIVGAEQIAVIPNVAVESDRSGDGSPASPQRDG